MPVARRIILVCVLLMFGLVAGPKALWRQDVSGEAYWSMTVLDDTLGTDYLQPDIAMDAEGRPHAVWYNAEQDEVRYGVFQGGTWTTTTVASAPDYGWWPDPVIALGDDGQVHLAYLLFGTLEYAHFDGAQWSTEVIDQDISNQGGDCSIALDGEGYPAVMYVDRQDGSPETIKLASKGTGGWSTQVVYMPPSGDTDSLTSLAFDSAGFPHVIYSTSGTDPNPWTEIVYADKAWGYWRKQTIATMSGTRYSIQVDLALDTEDRPHLVYEDLDDGMLHYTFQDAQGWHPEPATAWQGKPSLCVDAQGRVYLACGAEDDQVWYATRDNGVWVDQLVASLGWRSAMVAQGDNVWILAVSEDEALMIAHGMPVHKAAVPFVLSQSTPTPTPTATLVPTPTMTPTSGPSPTPTATPEFIQPNPGNWRNISGGYVRFSVTADGQVCEFSGSTECGYDIIHGCATISSNGSWLITEGDSLFSGTFTDANTCEGQTFHWDGIWGHCIGREDWVASP